MTTRVKMRGYKAFNSDLTCLGHQYEIGKEYAIEEDPIFCHMGFHFCREPRDCFHYYDLKPDMRFCRVEALGKIARRSDKCCTNHIRIVEEIPMNVIMNRLEINRGRSNFGFDNTGDFNVGDNNTGDYNQGQKNHGNFNRGGMNEGDRNIGYRNTGSYNFGNKNTGYGNMGSCNTGYFNKGNCNAGCFCLGYGFGGNYMFNKPVETCNSESYMDSIKSKLINVFRDIFLLTEFVWEVDPTAELPGFEFFPFVGGVLRCNAYTHAWENVFKKKPSTRIFIEDLPNYDPVIFANITGFKLEEVEI